ncbi:MAG: T9SS type A sorting domain-containing protein [Flavobacteriales bacterium]
MKKNLCLTSFVLFFVSCISIAQGVTLDTDFGAQGIIYGEPYPSQVLPSAVISDGDKIYTFAQAVQVDNTVPPQNSYVKRYNQDGSTDTGFGEYGVATIENYSGYNAVLDPDEDKLFCIGHGLTLNADVAVMVTSDQVVVGQSYEPEADHSYIMQYIKLTADQKIVIAGYYGNNLTYGVAFRVIRLNYDLTLDESFGEDGIVTLAENPYQEGVSYGMHDMDVDAEGRIYLLGKLDEANRLIRLNADGTQDETFEASPLVGEIASLNIYSQIEVLSNGKIYVLPDIGGFYDQPVLRLLNDGSMDTSFANGGVLLVEETMDELYFHLRKMTFDVNEDLYLTGNYYSNMGYSLGKFFMKVQNDGGLDAEFGTNIIPLNYPENTDYSFSDLRVSMDAQYIYSLDFLNYFIGENVHYDMTFTRYTLNLVEGILDHETANWSVYPNPANDFVLIASPEALPKTLKCEIFDQTGRMVISTGINQGRIDISEMEPGVYVCILRDGKANEIFHIVKTQ